MNEAQVRTVALFFFLAFLEEQVATVATTKAIGKLNRGASITDKFTNVNSAIVYYCYLYWKKMRKKQKHVNIGVEKMFEIPGSLDLEPWKQLQKETIPEEYIATIWSMVMGFSDEQIAEGLSVSVGTVQHRVSLSIRRLGHILEAGKRHG